MKKEQALINHIQEYIDSGMWEYEACYLDKTDLKVIIKALEQEPKWIPVSERLPEESLNSVIGWDAYRERCVFVQFIQGHWQITGSKESFDIKAWMPLPEPYKAESEGINETE